MQQDFLRAPLARFGTPVCRIGLSATYRPGRRTVFKALDEGLNYFLYFGFDTQMTSVLRETIYGRRDQFVLATGAYNWMLWHQPLRRTLERRLRQMGTDYIDVFHFLGVTRRKHFTQRVRDELQAVRESGLVRGVSISTHDRTLAAELARDGALDAVMVRYSAAHPGAETDVFPHPSKGNPAVIGYTATCWTHLLRRPRGYPENGRLPTAGMCYRFVMSNPAVHVCIMAPGNLSQFEQNLAEIRRGPLAEEDMQFMRSFGDFVRRRHRFFN
ncbi:MAG TPA: aldo/keto reductase [Candidatus Acidoferrales bacterium]|nr:aldo/keto reductase [Candidatus Acidoferrales bacterium]